MEDRYLFRGKYSSTGEWLVGNLVEYAGTSQIWVQTDNGKWNYIVDPATVGQCTAIRDANDALIFEGDIVRFTSRVSPYSEKVGFVAWRRGQYSIYCGSERSLHMYDFDELVVKRIEIIGNVHDNSELLEVGG